MLLDWFSTNGIALPFPSRHRTGSGTDGYSLRYFNPLTNEIRYFGTNLTTGFRVRFTHNPDGAVRQYAEQLDGETNAWEPWFDGIYRQVTDRGNES